MIRFKRSGEVVNEGGIVLARWSREPDPVYSEGRFRVWMEGDTPEDGRTFFPLYLSRGWVREESEKRSGAGLSM